MLELWYETPAREWTEALPVGNGRLGAMVFGGVPRERLQLNEETLWTGGPYSQVNPDARAHLEDVRALIFAGQYAEAEALAERTLMGRPLKQMSYQPAGDLWIEQDLPGDAVGYRRALDLDAAVAVTTFRAGDTAFTREVLATAADGVIVIRLSADRPGSISVCALADLRTARRERSRDGRRHRMARAQPRCRGDCRTAHLRRSRTSQDRRRHRQTDGTALRVEGADEAVVIVDAATSFRRFDDTSGDPDAAITARLSAVADKSFDELKSAHLAEHRRLSGASASILAARRPTDLPTDRRIAANPQSPDPALAALYVQFGRYLLLASSRPGTQPATLQGIWNDRIDPPWGSKYTANINLQMNYWLPDPANLSECMDPLIRLAEELSVTGAEIAAAHYGARGWVLHHNTRHLARGRPG